MQKKLVLGVVIVSVLILSISFASAFSLPNVVDWFKSFFSGPQYSPLEEVSNISNYSCTDTDIGASIYEAGTSTTLAYYCNNSEVIETGGSSGCIFYSATEKDICLNETTLLEVSCYFENASEEVFCENGCSEGACLGSNSLDAGLVVYYPLNNNSKDYSGNSKDGAWIGRASYVLEATNKLVPNLSGSNYIYTALNPNLKDDFTVSLWAKASSVNEYFGVLWSVGTNSGNNPALMHGGGGSYTLDNKLYFLSPYCGDGWVDTGYRFSDTNWHNFITERKGNTYYFYVDGTKTSNSASAIGCDSTSGGFNIGYQQSSYWTEGGWAGSHITDPQAGHYKGAIDEVRVYNRSLSDQEIQSLATQSLGTTQDVTCTDSDGGDNPFVKGTIYFNGVNKTDLCTAFNPTTGTRSVNYCDGNFCTLSEYYCMDLDGSVSNVHCAYGCSNGACLNETEQRAIAPYDSDGGNNPFVKGKATCIDAGVSDVCTIDEGVSNDPNQLMEFWCNPAGKNLNNGIYNCSNGCLSGACINQIPSTECQKIIGDANFGLGNDIIKGYKFVSNYSYPEEYSYSDLGNVTIYYSFYKDYANNKQMTISAMSIDDKSRLMKDTQWYKDYLYDLKRNEMWEVGHVQFYVGGDLQTQEYYIINGRNKEESTLLWPSENSLIIVENYDYNGQIPGVNDVNNFLDSLKNNKFTYVYTDAAVLDDLNSFASRLMPKCQSPVSESCSPSWAKKIEPVVCPEYGYQREIVNDNAGCSESHETQIYCSPGICSGCYVPRWFSYYNNGNNICMPYGTRFIFQDGQTSKIYEDKIVQEMINESGFDAKFEIRNDGTAFAQIKSDIDLNNLTNGEVASVDISYDGNVYHAKAGESLVIYPGTHQIDVTFYDSHGDKVQSEAAWVEISKIFYSDDPSQRYIEVVNRQDYPAYCDVDGWVKRQKDLEGSEWARCQNNYECQSNLCSYGECINTKALIGEARGFKGFVVKVLCKLSNVFDNADYNQCVVNNS